MTLNARVRCALVAFALPWVVIALPAQTPPVAQEAKPAAADARFDVASVKPQQQTIAEAVQANQGNLNAVFESVGIRTLPGGRLTARFVTLRALILRAYDIKDYQLEGGPAWVGSANFEINAKAAGEA